MAGPSISWAFQAHQPLRVIATLPRDTEVDIPLDTGIEITFDQDGVVEAASHVTIEPKVDGRFEQHGRVLAFVPEHPLDPATLYTITVTRGVEVGATGEELESDVRFRFETALAGQAADSTTFQFADDVFESPTSERPVIALWAFQEWDEGEAEPVPPTSAPIEVHRIRDLDAAVDAFRQVRSFPRWTRASTADLVSTTGLTRVFEFDAELRDSDGVLWFNLPERLPAGWYLVTLHAPTDRSRRCFRSPISPATWSSRRRRPSSGRTTSRLAARSPKRSSWPKALNSAGLAPMAR